MNVPNMSPQSLGKRIHVWLVLVQPIPVTPSRLSNAARRAAMCALGTITEHTQGRQRNQHNNYQFVYTQQT